MAATCGTLPEHSWPGQLACTNSFLREICKQLSYEGCPHDRAYVFCHRYRLFCLGSLLSHRKPDAINQEGDYKPPTSNSMNIRSSQLQIARIGAAQFGPYQFGHCYRMGLLARASLEGSHPGQNPKRTKDHEQSDIAVKSDRSEPACSQTHLSRKTELHGNGFAPRIRHDWIVDAVGATMDFRGKDGVFKCSKRGKVLTQTATSFWPQL